MSIRGRLAVTAVGAVACAAATLVPRVAMPPARPAAVERAAPVTTAATVRTHAVRTVSTSAPAAPPAPRTGPLEIDEAETLHSSDHDSVVFTIGGGGRRVADAPTPTTGSGFRLFDGNGFYRSSYVVRVVASPGVERLVPMVHAATAELSVLTRRPVTVAEGLTAPGSTPAPGEIHVVVSASSPCRGAWVGCGGPTFAGHEIRSGRAWFNARLFDRPLPEQQNAVRHELGHTLGLAHFDGAHAGRIQTMHSTRFDAPRYEEGDGNGLRALATNTVVPAAAFDAVSYSAGVLRLAGRLEHVDARSKVTLLVDGHGFALTPASGPFRRDIATGAGTHRLCIRIAHVTGTYDLACRTAVAPGDPFGNLDAVRVRGSSITVEGWAIDPQTAQPVAVGVVVSGISLDTWADQPRHDVARVHPAYGPRHGYAVNRTAVSGRQRICVVARNVGGGRDVTLGCRDVQVEGPKVIEFR